MSQALYEITVNALLDRDRPLTRADWDAAVARVGGHRVPQLLAELTDAGLVGADLLPGAVAEAWASADRPLDRLLAALAGTGVAGPVVVDDGSADPAPLRRAVERAGGGQVVKVEFDRADDDRDDDRSDGRDHWEVEVVNGTTEHDLDIDATTGQVLDHDVDRDHRTDDDRTGDDRTDG